MKKEIFLLIPLLCALFQAHAQQMTPQVISSNGGVNQVNGIYLQWTLGEPWTESLFTGYAMYSQGFHQPLLVAETAVVITEIPATGYQVSIAPNPVTSMLTISINSPAYQKLVLTLTDAGGKRIHTQTVNGKTNQAKMYLSYLKMGIYLLEIREASGKHVKTFKVFKGS